jgi:hypothetical protein
MADLLQDTNNIADEWRIGAINWRAFVKDT